MDRGTKSLTRFCASASISATSVPSSMPARIGAIRRLPNAPWCCWRRRYCRRSPPRSNAKRTHTPRESYSREPPRRILFVRWGLERRTGPASDDERRAAKEELINPVSRAIFRQFLEVKHLAHGETHGRDHHPMPRLVDFHGLVRPYLDAPSVGADRGDFLVLAPIAILEFDPGRIAARVGAPLLLMKTALHLPGAQDDEITAPDFDILLLGAFVEFVVADRLAILEPRHAAEARNVEQHAATDHFVSSMLDAEFV